MVPSSTLVVRALVMNLILISLKELEQKYLLWAATRYQNKSELAQKLGISERTLYRKLEGIE